MVDPPNSYSLAITVIQCYNNEAYDKGLLNTTECNFEFHHQETVGFEQTRYILTTECVLHRCI